MKPILELLSKHNLPHNEKTPRIRDFRLVQKKIHDGGAVSPSNVSHKGFGYCDFVCERSFELVKGAAQYNLLVVKNRPLRVQERTEQRGHDFRPGFTDQHFLKFKRLRVCSKFPVAHTPILEVCTGVRMKMQRNENNYQSEILHSFDIEFTLEDERSGQTTQYIAIIKFSQVLGKMRLCKNSNGVWLEVELRYPPLMRRSIVLQPENNRNQIERGPKSLHSLHDLRDEIRKLAESNAFQSMITSGKANRMNNRSWVRTGDPFTPLGLLGGYLIYALELDCIEHSAPFLQILHRNGLISSYSPEQPLVELPPPTGASPLGILDSNHRLEGDEGDAILTEYKNRRDLWARHRACCSNKLSFGVRYLLGCLVTNYVMDPASMDKRLEDFLINVGEEHATRLLQTIIARHDPHDFIYKPVDALQSWNSILEKEKKKEGREVYSVMNSTAEVWVRRVVITPLRVCLMPPEIEGSSRAFRILNASNVPPDYLLRVTFSEETTRGFYPLKEHTSQRSIHSLEQRLRQVMRGLRICDRVYKHLGSSSSQLRSHGAWFLYRQEPMVVHRLLGDFKGINVVAKYAARVGQSFAASVAACRVPSAKYTIIPDVYTADRQYCFSDGVGIMSLNLAKEVAESLGMSEPPSGIQFRFAGAKGMLSLMPPEETGSNLISKLGSEHDMFIRESQIKFESRCDSLDVLNVARWMPAFLNRPLIQVLECRGVKMNAIMDLLDSALHMVSTMLKTSHDALAALEKFSAIALNPDDTPTNDAHDLSYKSGNLDFTGDDRACYEHLQVAKDMLRAGFDVNFDPFLQKTIRAFQRLILVQLRTKARILVPEAVNLFGVLDETGVLKEDEVYVGVDDAPLNDRRIVVSRNPTMHPGDVRVLQSVKPKELEHIKNLIVFSKNGSRPAPDCMSGGDLDGDIFTVIWDDSLIPSSHYPPMLNESTVRQNAKCAKVTLEDLQNFFVDYMKLDNLGRIATMHLLLADVAPGGPTTEICLRLCELASHAVDFAKTGVPADLESEFGAASFKHPDAYPDFMERPHRPSYPSKKANGVLFRKVVAAQKESREQHSSILTPGSSADGSLLDTDLLFQGWEEFVEEAQLVHRCYAAEVKTLTRQFGIWDEAALVSAQVEFFTAQFIRREKVASVLPRLHRSLKLIRKQFRSWFADGLDLGNMGKDVPVDAFRKASAWYWVAYEGHKVEEVGFSLPWVIHDVLCLLKRAAIQERSMLYPISQHNNNTQQIANHDTCVPSSEGLDDDDCGVVKTENGDKEGGLNPGTKQQEMFPFELCTASVDVWDSCD